ncbi:ferritin family protein [bacterium]|nr:ferritin family protein [bacterium]
MEILETVNKLLDFAIEGEQRAYEFYTELAEKCKFPVLKKTLEEFALEEKGHKTNLMNIKEGKIAAVNFDEKVMDLGISDYLVDVDPESDPLDYQNILIIAMKKEKSSYRLYTKLAEMTDNVDVKNLLRSIAIDEAKHKLRLEIEYDEVILSQN